MAKKYHRHRGQRNKGTDILVDFEGFQLNQKFFFKEFTICEIFNNSFQNFYIKSPILKNNKTINWLIKHHHQIPIDYGSIEYKSLINLLRKYNIIFCKGNSKVSIIQKILKNKIIDIEKLGCPAYTATQSNKLSCELEQHKKNIHCALNKAYFYYKWLKQYIQLTSNKIY